VASTKASFEAKLMDALRDANTSASVLAVTERNLAEARSELDETSKELARVRADWHDDRKRIEKNNKGHALRVAALEKELVDAKIRANDAEKGVQEQLGALGAFSLHWFPYDRVGVVNADP
jgi:hypothetical protein